MKKILLVISMMFALNACVFEKMQYSAPVNDDGDVVVDFSIVVPEAQAVTKTLDIPAIESLTVVVFDENGFFVTAREATQIGGAAFETANVSNVKTNASVEFQVSLPQSTSPRNLHFVANKLANDFSYGLETDVMTSLITTGRNDAYWQVVKVKSILPEDEDNLKTSLSNIPMVRNYAKIVVVNGDEDNFTFKGFRVLNAPTSGTIVPYNVTSEDFQNYWKNFEQKKVGLTYAELNGDSYHGFMPAGFNEAEGLTDLPSSSEWTKDPVYTYERIYVNKESEDEGDNNNLSILIWGEFKDSTPGESYYKVDLYDPTLGNYDVLRNIQYTVNITDVLGDGYGTADEAANNIAGNNISNSLSTQSLLNISDGNCRLFVEYVTKRVVSEEIFYLKYKFAPYITEDLTNPASYNNAIANTYNSTGTPSNTNPLTITCVDPEGTEGDVISGWEYDSQYGVDSEGWSRIKITPMNGYNGENWMEDIVIKSTYNVGTTDNPQTVVLSRTVKLYRLNRYALTVSCDPVSVDRTIGASLTVNTVIPANLPDDIFPLVFSIEAENLSIYPEAGRTNDLNEVITMPVISGTSIIQNSSKQSFHFDRTLTLAEYQYLVNNHKTADNKVSVPSYFKTNVAESATTVHVYNEYFNRDNCSFSNPELPLEMSATLEGEQYYGAGKTVTLNLTTNKAGTYTVTFTEEGASPLSTTAPITVNAGSTSGSTTYTTDTWSGKVTASVEYEGNAAGGTNPVTVEGRTRNVLVLGNMTAGSNAPNNNASVTIYNASNNRALGTATWSQLKNGGVEVTINNLADMNTAAVYFQYTTGNWFNSQTYTTGTLNGNQAVSGSQLNFTGN